MKIQLILSIVLFMSSFLFAQEKRTLKQDSSQYDTQFVAKWGDLKSNGVELRKDSIIISGDIDHVVIIPTDLPLKQDVKYQAIKGDIIYDLVVNRLNYTNVYFSIVGIQGQKNVFERTDTAILESSFHLGSEGIYENNKGEIYPMNDYIITDVGEHKLLIPEGTTEVVHYYESTELKRIELFFKRIQELK